jgi:hypothetical protein
MAFCNGYHIGDFMKLHKIEGQIAVVFVPENMEELNALQAVFELVRVNQTNFNTFFDARVSINCDCWVDTAGYLEATTGLKISPLIIEPKEEMIAANESFELTDLQK